jgi:formate--tetrahydrofolate ligase
MRGAEGARALAERVIEATQQPAAPFQPLYPLDASVPDKISAVASKMYGADDVAYTKSAERDLKDIVRLGYDRLPICIAKTQNSLSDDPKLRGRPRDFEVTVRGIQVAAGAGFLVVLTGEIMRMPGLPKVPAAAKIDLQDGTIVGLS